MYLHISLESVAASKALHRVHSGQGISERLSRSEVYGYMSEEVWTRVANST